MTSNETHDALADLVTLRDWWRYGVTQFTKAGLVYGHGTDNAAGEAAFLLLSSLKLPIDTLEPWLECRLTRTERGDVLSLFQRRIASRKPASYLTNTAWIQGHQFYVDERVIIPRSFIGELLCQSRLSAAIGDPNGVTRVLELCTGSGCLSILAAEAFPDAQIDASDLSPDALDVARRNVSDYGLNQRIRLLQSDLYQSIPPDRYDLIIANPPYVTTQAVAAFPPEYQAEPVMAHAGGSDGLDLVNRILEGAARYLAPHGAIVMEIGQARDALEATWPDLPFLWLDTETSEGEVFALQAADLAGSIGES
ncbi:MAG: 50S ribosomal protein L3 N(5)-glutamine methyltransferase [Hyphomicrobium sp.]|nr:50S ribosomal protein L3 N(5)-glutamine methyltransferase [Hyphomicrobium sp.]